jgi:Tfp pilus assembly protein PilO
MLSFKLPNFSNLSSRERIMAGAGIAVVSLLLLDKVAIGPLLNNARKINRDALRLEEEIRTQNRILARKPQIMAESQAYKDYLSDDSPEQVSMASLLREIETLGRQSGVTLGAVKPVEGGSSEINQEFAIEVEFRATLAQWVHFVYLIESSSAFFHIDRAKIDRASDELNLLQSSIRLVTKIVKNGSVLDNPPGEG